MKNQIQTNSYKTEKTILFQADNVMLIPCTVSDDGVDEVDGKKIIYAGTPLIAIGSTGSHMDLSKAFTVNTETPNGIAFRDIDVTDGEANAECLTRGAVAMSKFEDSVKAMYNADVLMSLDSKILVVDA